MSATRNRNGRNGASAETESEQPQPQPQPETMDLAAAVASEQVSKAQRVYVDVPGIPHAPTDDGTIATVQREQRADGSLGEYLLTAVRKNRDGSESAQRYSIAQLQALKSALEGAAVTLFK